jgi:hypothetical protein
VGRVVHCFNVLLFRRFGGLGCTGVFYSSFFFCFHFSPSLFSFILIVTCAFTSSLWCTQGFFGCWLTMLTVREVWSCIYIALLSLPLCLSLLDFIYCFLCLKADPFLLHITLFISCSQVRRRSSCVSSYYCSSFYTSSLTFVLTYYIAILLTSL